MRMTALFKKMLVFTLFFIPICLFAQNDSIVNEKLPVNAEKLEVIFNYSAITMFNTNTTKVTVSNYGNGKIKKRSGSASTTKVLGITYNESKYKFFIDFNNSLNQSSELTGTKTSSNILKTTKAVITTNIENSRPWNFFLRIDKLDFLNVDSIS